MNKVQQALDEMDKELSLIECVCNSRRLMETYNMTQEFHILWDIYDRLKKLLEENTRK